MPSPSRLTGGWTLARVSARPRRPAAIADLRMQEQPRVLSLEQVGRVSDGPEAHRFEADDGVLASGLLSDLQCLRRRVHHVLRHRCLHRHGHPWFGDESICVSRLGVSLTPSPSRRIRLDTHGAADSRVQFAKVILEYKRRHQKLLRHITITMRDTLNWTNSAEALPRSLQGVPRGADLTTTIRAGLEEARVCPLAATWHADTRA